MIPYFMMRASRLLISHFTVDDAAFILELVNTEGWLKYIGDKNIRSMEDATRYLLDGPLSDYKKDGFGLFKIIELDSGESVGMCGLLERNYLEYPDMGFALLPEFEGRGFMTEACEYLLQWYSEVLGLERISAIVQQDNSRSIGLLRKLDFTFDKMIERDGDMLRLYQKIL